MTVADAATTMLALTAAQDSVFVAAGYALEVHDTAAHIETLTVDEIASLTTLHVSAIATSDASLAVTTAQAIAFESAHIALSTPAGATVSASDTAANLQALTAVEIDALPGLGVAGMASTNAGVILTVAQALALETIGFKIAVPSGDKITIADTAAHVETLTAVEIAGLTAIGVSGIGATGSGVTLNVAQALALETAAVTLAVPSGDIAAISDTAANIETLTASRIASLTTLHVTQIQATDASLTMTVAQALALESAHIALRAPTGATVGVSDTAANLQALTAAQITALKGVGIAQLASNNGAVKYTVAQTVALEGAGVKLSASNGAVTLSDTAANVQTLTAVEIDALPGLGVAGMASTNAGVILTVAQALALETIGFKIAVPSGDKITIADTAAHVETLTAVEIAGLTAIGVSGIGATGSGVTLNVAQALALETAAVTLAVPSGDIAAISDTAANIETLTASRIAGLTTLHVTQIQATDASLTTTVAQALALESAKVGLSAPAGATVGVSDTAANLQALTAAQITALKGVGIAQLASNNGAVKYTVAQTVALEGAGVKLSASSGAVTLSDTAANVQTLTAVEIDALPGLGVAGMASTNAGVILTVAQALALETIGFKIAVPSGDKITIADTAAHVETLTAVEIAGLTAIGVSGIGATGSGVTLDVAQALALETAAVTLAVPSGDIAAISDTAANIETLTASRIAGLTTLHVTQIQATDASLTTTVAQALALESAKVGLSAPAGATVGVSDTAANLQALTAAQITALKGVRIAQLASNNGAVKYTVAQTVALEGAGVKLSASSGAVTLSDTAANVQTLTAVEIDALPGLGVAGMASTNAGVILTVAQALALETIGFKIAVPSGDKITIADTAAHVETLTAVEIAGLTAIGVSGISATGSGVTLDVAQALALETAAVTLAVPSGDIAAISDTAANIETLTASRIASLTTLHVTQIQATDASLTMTVAQALALESAHIALRAPTGATVGVSDTAANLQALTAAQITALKGVGIAQLASNNGAVKYTVAQTVALEGAGVKLSASNGAVTLSDTAANVQTLTAVEIDALPGLGVAGMASTNAGVILTVAQALALETIGFKIAVPSGDKITIADTAAHVETLTAVEIAGLTAIGVSGIGATGSGVTLNVAQALALETAAVTLAVPSGDIAAISDTAANIETLTASRIASLTTLHVTQIQATDASLTMTVAQALALESAKVGLSAPAGDQDSIIDTAAHIERLTAAEIPGLAPTLHVTQIQATDASLAVTTAQAIAFESAHIALAAPAGSTVGVSDTAANLQALTAAQITALTSVGIDYLNATNANVSYAAAQTSSIVTAGLTLTAAGADTVTENYSNGNYSVYRSGHLIQEKNVNADFSYDIAYFNVTGQSYGSYENIYNTSGTKVADAEDMTNGSGALILSGSGLTISSSSGAQSVTVGEDIFAINAHATEAVTSTGTTGDIFIYSAGFGQDAITGFAATGSSHDTFHFSASMFSYLTPGMTQPQELNAVLNHATQVGSVLTIFDTAGDSLALNSLTTTTLAANPNDLKFV